MEKAINMVWELFVEAWSSKKEKEGKKKGKRNKGKKERKRKEIENEKKGRRKGNRKKEKRKAVGFFLSFELLFWSAFGTTLCHVYCIFCGIIWNMAYFVVSIETGL